MLRQARYPDALAVVSDHDEEKAVPLRIHPPEIAALAYSRLDYA